MSEFQISLIILGCLLIVFIALRKFNSWYWRTNEIIQLQKDQNIILNEVLQELKGNNKKVSEQQNAFEEWKKSNPGKTLNDYLVEIKKK